MVRGTCRADAFALGRHGSQQTAAGSFGQVDA
jgi:hypothetical protein